MAEDALGKQIQIDPLVLQRVVRQDRFDPNFEILSVTISTLSNDGLMSPEGVFLVQGEGRSMAGPCPWSVVLKQVKFRTGEIPDMLETSKRELQLAQAHLFDNLPGPLVTPRIYHTAETQEGGEMWMEYMSDSSPRSWNLENFKFAAYEIARFNANCLASTDFNAYQPYLAHDWLRKVFMGLTSLPEERVWRNPYVQKYITADLRTRYEKLIADQDRFYRAVESLPHLFLHRDFHRRNLMVRNSGENRQLVALDWSACTMGPLGADLSALIGASSFLYEMNPADLPDFAPAIYDAYLEGLYAAGWQGDPARIRMGATAWMAMHNNIYPAIIAMWTSDITNPDEIIHFGRSPDQFVAGWVDNFRYFLGLADEARSLMDKFRVL